MEDLTGKQFGPYQIVAPLGEGGMAAVYKAYQPGIERYVALKILPRQFGLDPQFMARFEQEAKIVAKLQHPHILPVFDYGRADDGYAYIAMPFIQSGTLAGPMRGAPLPLARIRRILSQVGDALDYAHSQGLIHRDVKPSNVLLDERDNCMLTDFGIAKMVESSAHLTATGGFIGTPAYMSPEQALGRPLDGRSDIYALGIILYEMVVGRVPYKAETPMAVAVKQINDPLPMPRRANPNLPEAVEQVLLKALAKQPEDRYATAGDMVRALRAVIPEAADEMVTAAAVEGPTTPALAVETVDGRMSSTGIGTVATQRRDRRAGPKVVLIAAALIVIVVVVGVAVWLAGRSPAAPPLAERPEGPTSAAAEVVTTEINETSSTVSPTSLTLYDDFSDPAYEGEINPTKWLPEFEESCQVSQQAGVMAFTNTALPTGVSCNLTVGVPEQVAIGDLGVFEARLQVSSDHNGEYLNQGLSFWTGESPGGGWYAFCGLDTSGETAEALFEVVDWATGENYDIEQSAPVEYDHWYTVRLAANPETMVLDCYVDDTRLGSVALAEAAVSSEASFQKIINGWRAAEAVGTTYVDDVRLTPGPAETAGSAAAPAEVAAVYDDFEDPDFDSTWNPELWEGWDNTSDCEVGQQEGVLRISCREPNGSGLNALDYAAVPFGEFDFVEAGLRLDDEIQTDNGGIIVTISTSIDRWAECGLAGNTADDVAYLYCGVYSGNDTEYEVDGPEADYDTWRTVRLDLDPETAAITFVVDGQEIGAYTPQDVEALKQANVTVELHIYFEEGSLVTGYFDDVRIGP